MTVDLKGVLVRAKLCLISCRDAWEDERPMPDDKIERSLREIADALRAGDDNPPEVTAGTI